MQAQADTRDGLQSARVVTGVPAVTKLLPCARAGKLSRDTGSAHEQHFVRAVIDLHDKYMQARARRLQPPR